MASSALHRPYELTLGLIKPSLYASTPDVSRVMRLIKAGGFEVSTVLGAIDEKSLISVILSDLPLSERFYFPRLVLAMSEPFLALALGKENAVADWRSLIGPTHVYKGQWQHPTALRSQFGISDTRNAFHGSDSTETARKELSMVFEGLDIDWLLANHSRANDTG